MRGSTRRGVSWALGLLLAVGSGCTEEPVVEPPPPEEVTPSCETSCDFAERNCGTAVNRCGETLECGTCSATQTCGGGGLEGLCGGNDCAVECPSGYSCREDQVCVGGTSQSLTLDLKGFEVEGRLLRDGKPIRETCSGVFAGNSGYATYWSHLVFIDVASEALYQVNLTCTQENGWTFRGWVPPGAYRVDFQFIEHFRSAPPPLRLTEFFSVQADRKGLVFDVSSPRVKLAGRVTHNGRPFPTTGGPYILSFTELRTGALFELEVGTDGRFKGNGTRGTYRVEWMGVKPPTNTTTYVSGPGLPPGPFTVSAGMRIDADGEGLALDLVTAEVTGAVTFDGQQLGHLSCGDSYVRFTGLANQVGYRLPVHCTQAEGWSYSGSLPPGSYRGEVVLRPYNVLAAGERFPTGTFVTVPSVELQPGAPAVPLEVKRYAVSGRIVLGGAELPTGLCSRTDPDGVKATLVEFQNEETGDSIQLPADCSAGTGWTFQGRVPPASYRLGILTRPATEDDPYPLKSKAGYRTPFTVEVATDVTGLVVDPEAISEISGTLSFVGDVPVLPVVLCHANMRLELFEAATGRKHRLQLAKPATCSEAAPGVWSFRGNVPHGTWQVKAVHDYSGYVFGEHELEPVLSVEGPREGVELQAVLRRPDWVPVGGTVTRNGAPLGWSQRCGHYRNILGASGPRDEIFPEVVLTSPLDGSSYHFRLSCGAETPRNDAWTFSGWAPPGTYRVEVRMDWMPARHAIYTSQHLDRVPGPYYVVNPRLQIP